MIRRMAILAALVATMAPAVASAHGDRWRYPPPRYYGPPLAYLYVPPPPTYYAPPPAYLLPPPVQPLYFDRRPPLYYAPPGIVPPPYPYSGWTR
jgi:hypothetical protein